MKNFNEYLKNSNSIVRLESERILNVLKRYGFEVVNEKVDYVEGFYITYIVGFPFEHAFNLKDGNVIDVTSSKFGFKVIEWFGIVLSNDIIFEYQMSDCPEWITTLQYYFYTHIKKQKIWQK